MISVVGAGPAGCYAAYLLAKAGMKVQVFEEHSSAGKPVHCTGIVTSGIKGFVDINNDFVINKVSKARIYSQNNNFVGLNLKSPNLILDRAAFDSHLAKKAEDAGALVLPDTKCVGIRNSRLVVKRENKLHEIGSDIIIGADGPLSTVAKSSGLYGNRHFMVGVQARAYLENDNAVEFYPFAGGFAWVVPESSNIVRIGVSGRKNVAELFNSFLKQKNVSAKKIIEKQGGLIPLYRKMRLQRNNVYLVGDAALQVKATTGGGIVQGLSAASCLASSILQNKSYGKLLRSLRLELWLHRKARNILDRFSASDYNLLIRLFKKEKNRMLIESIDRDNISALLLRLIISEPRLVYFMRHGLV